MIFTLALSSVLLRDVSNLTNEEQEAGSVYNRLYNHEKIKIKIQRQYERKSIY